jgi:thiol-disulfide isomerase/thioredoxin
MTRRSFVLSGVLALLASQDAASAGPRAPQAPDLAGTAKDWINGKPVSFPLLKGKVVVVCFWTFGCINCRRTLPFWNGWAKTYAGKDVAVVTIHTPETDAERVVDSVSKFIEKEKLVFPVLIDNDMTNSRRWGLKWWPTTYLVDKKGRVRGRWDGELDAKGSGDYKRVAKEIETLRAEK